MHNGDYRKKLKSLGYLLEMIEKRKERNLEKEEQEDLHNGERDKW
jgi:hypothetical protein